MNDVRLGENGYKVPAKKLPYSLAFVIPALNEEGNIVEVVERSVKVLTLLCDHFEVVVIDDASTDATAQRLEECRMKYPQLRVLTNTSRMGCHPSECKGLLTTASDWAFFLPADLQIVPEEILTFLDHMKGDGVIFGNRVGRADSGFRCGISRAYNWIVRTTFQTGVRDIDSVAVFSRKVIDEVLPRLHSESAFSNVELVMRIRRSGFWVKEIPIRHFSRQRGKAKGINVQDLLRVPVNFLSLFCSTYLPLGARKETEEK